MKSATICSLWLAALLAVPLAAQPQRVERIFPASEDALIEVRNLNGRVSVRSWSERQVKVEALRHSSAVETHFEQAANRIHIHTHLLQNSASAGERAVDYTIWAPPDARLRINLETGQLEVQDFTENVTIESVAAEVRLGNLNGHISVQSLNGNIYAERCSGHLEARSISGSLHFSEVDTVQLVANTTSGDITYEGALRPGGSYEFINHEGAIELRLPPAASFELNAHSVKGDVLVSEFPLKTRNHGRLRQPDTVNSLLGTVQAGDAMVRATSFSGTIRVRQQ